MPSHVRASFNRTTRSRMARCYLFATVALVWPIDSAAAQTDRPIAFVGVNVVPMDSERVLENHMVLVAGGRIVRVAPSDPSALPPGVQTIAGNGRYLMPGLADMHVHVPAPEDLVLWVANGVTTVRNLHATGSHRAMRDDVASGRLFGPTIVTSGPLLDGPGAAAWGATIITTAAEGTQAVQQQYEQGYDFVKVYSGLSAQAYFAVVAAAAAHGMPVVGHVPRSVGVTGALLAGQRSIEHLAGYTYEVLADHLSMEHGTATTTIEEWYARPVTLANMGIGPILPDAMIDEHRLRDLAVATRVSGAWNVPTLVMHRGLYRTAAERQQLLADPRLRYVNPAYVAVWTGMGKTLDEQGTTGSADFEFWRRLHRDITAALHEAGARLLVGTDAPNPFVIPGFSVHDELQALIEAGLSRYDALSAATRNAAEFLGTPSEFGTVTPGARADLVLVDGNPLDDVSVLSRPAGVMTRGTWFWADDLTRRLEAVVASYAGGGR